MSDPIKRDDALAAIDRALNNPKRYATGDLFDCYAAIRALPTIDPAPAKQVTLSEAEAIREAAWAEALDAAHQYTLTQYGMGFLKHPVDRERIESLIGETK